MEKVHWIRKVRLKTPRNNLGEFQTLHKILFYRLGQYGRQGERQRVVSSDWKMNYCLKRTSRLMLSLWIWRLLSVYSRPAQDIRAPSCNMLTLLSVSETMVGSLISRAHLLPLLRSWPQLSCNHLLLLQVSNSWNRSEGYLGGIMGGTWDEMRQTAGQIWQILESPHSLESKLLLQSKFYKTSFEKVNSWRRFVEFLTIRANKKICQVLIYFSIVDFYLRRLAIFDRLIVRISCSVWLKPFLAVE